MLNNPTLPNLTCENKLLERLQATHRRRINNVVPLAAFRPKPRSPAASTATPLDIEAYRSFRKDNPGRPSPDDRFRLSRCRAGAAILAHLDLGKPGGEVL